MTSEPRRRKLHNGARPKHQVPGVLNHAGLNPGIGPWNQGPPPKPGKYWVCLGRDAVGLIRITERDIAAWPKEAKWKPTAK